MKALIYTTALNVEDRAINDTELFEYTRPSWEHYTKKYDLDFYVIDKELHPDTSPHWFRYWIFDLKPGYDFYLYVDADIMVRWDAPNIFDNFKDPNKLYAIRDNSGLSWVWEGIKIYQNMFPDVNLDWNNYFNSGVMLFSNKHQELINGFKEFYISNYDVIKQYRDTYRKGFDQNIFNYFCKHFDIPVELIPERWNLFHMVRKEVFYNSYFIDMAFFWHFNGLGRENQISLVKQLWEQIKDKYEN